MTILEIFIVSILLGMGIAFGLASLILDPSKYAEGRKQALAFSLLLILMSIIYIVFRLYVR